MLAEKSLDRSDNDGPFFRVELSSKVTRCCFSKKSFFLVNSTYAKLAIMYNISNEIKLNSQQKVLFEVS